MQFKTLLSATAVSLILSACGSGNSPSVAEAPTVAPVEPAKPTVFLFPASNGSNGYELWKSDGSEESTAMVKDINSSGDSKPSNFVRVGDNTFFVADDGTNGEELWVSDGTEAGTKLVKDINTSGDSDSSHLTAFKEKVYFSAEDSSGEDELWVSDGTEAGTKILKDINSTSDGSYPYGFFVHGETMYFQADDGSKGSELWKTDGTEAGTSIAAEIYAGATGSGPDHIVAMGDAIYFAANDSAGGRELWKYSSGSASRVIDIKTGTDSSNPDHLTVVGSTLYFTAYSNAEGQELWSSDGTAANTKIVQDIRIGTSGSSPSNLTAVGESLFFSAYNGTNGTELWKTDGTTTEMVKNINTTSSVLLAKSSASMVKAIGPSSDQSSSPYSLVAIGSNVFFSAVDDASNGRELWASNGTETGTIMIKDINTDSNASSDPTSLGQLYYSDQQALSPSGEFVLFQAKSADKGVELWKSDGTADGTVMVLDIYPDAGYGLQDQSH